MTLVDVSKQQMSKHKETVSPKLYLFSIKMDPHSQLSTSFISFSSRRPTPASHCVSLMCVEFHAVHRSACFSPVVITPLMELSNYQTLCLII